MSKILVYKLRQTLTMVPIEFSGSTSRDLHLSKQGTALNSERSATESLS
jgi:hypothetical protein